jgi:hypothetical protein
MEAAKREADWAMGKGLLDGGIVQCEGYIGLRSERPSALEPLSVPKVTSFFSNDFSASVRQKWEGIGRSDWNF